VKTSWQRFCIDPAFFKKSGVNYNSIFSVLISINYQSTKPFFGHPADLILRNNFERLDFDVFARTIEGSYPEFSMFSTANKSFLA